MAELEAAGSDKGVDEAVVDGNANLQAAEVGSLATAGSSKQAVEHLLASSEPDLDLLLDPAAPWTAVAAIPEQQGPVAALVNQFEHLGSTSGHPKDHGPSLASLFIRLAKSPLSSGRHRKKSVLANRGRLKPLEIPGVTAPADDTDITEPIKPLPPAVQGAAARNDAAMAAHRARLHHRRQLKDQWAVASRQTKTHPVGTRARQVSPVPPSRLNLDVPVSFSEEDTPERSSISAAWARIRSLSPLSGRSGMEASSPRSSWPPLRRFGSVVAPTGSQPSSLRSRPPALTIAEIMRQASVALPSDLGDSPPWSPMSTSQPPAVTVAQIMRQNTRLSPLDFVPPSPSAGAPAPPRAFPVAACTHSLSSGGQSDADLSSPLLRGISGVDAGPERSGNGRPEYWSHPGAGSPPATPRRRVRLPPISPTHSGILLSSDSIGRAPRAANM